MAENLLRNGGFEADWGTEKSHRCLVLPVDGQPYFKDVGNVFVPPGWTFWFRHKPQVWDQPEGRDALKAVDSRRVRSDEKAYMYFSFYRRHNAGLLQRVQVAPGTRLRLMAYAHAWSSTDDDPLTSDGVGGGVRFIPGDQVPPLNGNKANDAIGNSMFCVGIDPLGGLDPYSGSVVWGNLAAAYNGYSEPFVVEARAEAEMVTVFLRNCTLWAFKHNDAYWDDAVLEEVEEMARGKPREQYARTYVLLPPKADASWAQAVVEATWNRRRFTFGASADDAGVGDLEARRVIAVNPAAWGKGEDGRGLLGFFEKHYPGVKYVPVEAATPDLLRQKLASL